LPARRIDRPSVRGRNTLVRARNGEICPLVAPLPPNSELSASETEVGVLSSLSERCSPAVRCGIIAEEIGQKASARASGAMRNKNNAAITSGRAPECARGTRGGYSPSRCCAQAAMSNASNTPVIPRRRCQKPRFPPCRFRPIRSAAASDAPAAEPAPRR
jgi:hypothetical protein